MTYSWYSLNNERAFKEGFKIYVLYKNSMHRQPSYGRTTARQILTLNVHASVFLNTLPDIIVSDC